MKRIWFTHDPKSWHIEEFRRVAMFKLMRRRLEEWNEWLRFDSTPKFYKMISRLRKEKDGAVIGIAGPKRAGKSIFGQMVLSRCVSSVPHVLFRYREFEAHVHNIGDTAIGVQVDEDLKATGSESRNLVVHINNAFETSRKAELWAICTGVNLSFEGWGDTLDLRLIPWGFNLKYQATRAAVVDQNRDFLGFMVLQRKHLPEGIVRYANEQGVWGEYKARAIAYSRSVIREGGAMGAVDSVSETRHVEALKDHIRVNYHDKGLTLPKGVMLDRVYRQAQLPSKSIRYMTGIIAWALAELKEELENDPAAIGREDKDGQGFRVLYMETTGEDWKRLREAYFKRWGNAAWALYRVPLY
ncbi:MAG: hypothetical protein KAJ19_19765, partial [Gammaproteobacteria bacterium]|nr:hypothetical protein [Gammaproteobacteria bacterium]